jgi:hypothetical protein
VRLNGTSDLPLFKEFAEWCVNTGNAKLIPKNVLFYDYTKIVTEVTYSRAQELMNPLKMRHKVSYSLSERVTSDGTGFDTAKRVLLNGGSVAAVFKVNPRGVPEFVKSTGKPNKVPAGWIKIPDGKGKFKFYAPLLGFFEVVIWLLAIGQIMQHLDNFMCYFAYGLGFATGNYLGIILEEKSNCLRLCLANSSNRTLYGLF